MAEKLTPKIKAVMPIQRFGQTAEMDALKKLNEENKVGLIEDAVQPTELSIKERKPEASETCGV